MKIRPEQLAANLQRQLLPVYVIFGDETLIQLEAADALRQHCREQGFNEREVLVVDSGFDWNRLLSASQSMSLFGDRKLIELRIDGKPDRNGSAAIAEYCEHADPNNVLLISAGKIDRKSQGTKWFKAVEKHGASVQAWPVNRQQLPQWLGNRMRERGLSADNQALNIIADRVEGNLLAAAQEVEKLQVLFGQAQLSAEQVASAVASSARYDVFGMIEQALAGRPEQALRMLHSLRAEGGDGIALMGALNAELRKLQQCAWQLQQGGNMDRILDKAGVWDKKKPSYRGVLSRQSPAQLNAYLEAASAIDQAQKGMSEQAPWQLIDAVLCGLGGKDLGRALAS